MATVNEYANRNVTEVDNNITEILNENNEIEKDLTDIVEIFNKHHATVVLTQIEAILNSRPLGPISSDRNDVSALTPGHFLTLAPLNSLPDEDLTDIKMGRLGRWQIVQKIQQSFWLKWHREYLHTLLQRSKWTDPSVPIRTGDLVLLKDYLSPQLKWHLARVVEEHGGIDGITRVVTVKTAKGTLSPVTKVCPLPSIEH
ncbi:hypothetical protein JTB14_019898 [Gonioctena quinquepunctata]|nr:hypothetical protein JTB14_019898 [Gonioctena quinquepunctata]